eukprot:1607512-Prymnesium_polylepis.1
MFGRHADNRQFAGKNQNKSAHGAAGFGVEANRRRMCGAVRLRPGTQQRFPRPGTGPSRFTLYVRTERLVVFNRALSSVHRSKETSIRDGSPSINHKQDSIQQTSRAWPSSPARVGPSSRPMPRARSPVS